MITPEGVSVLQNVAEAYRDCSGLYVQMSGHTDRKGTEASNVDLSKRMVKNVREFLVARGIPDDKVQTDAYGEFSPQVDTADGVSEPKNRRVELYFGLGAGW